VFLALFLFVSCLTAAGLLVEYFRLTRLRARTPRPHPPRAEIGPQVAAVATPPPLPAQPRRRAEPIRVAVPQPHPGGCAVETCRRLPKTWISLSSRNQLFLCPEHALAVETKRARWRITDPRSLLKRISRVTVARA
jgi:hypothetical protein